MLADATVYGIALCAVGRGATHKVTAAAASGIVRETREERLGSGV